MFKVLHLVHNILPFYHRNMMIKTEAYSGGGGKENIPPEIWRRKKVGLMLNRGETDNPPFSPLSMNFKSKTKNQ